MANSISVLFLNAWGMRYQAEILSLIMRQRVPFDLICLTEVAQPKSPLPQAKIYQEGLAAPVLIDGHRYLAEHLYSRYDHQFDASDTETWVCTQSNDTYHHVGYGSSLFWLRTPRFRILRTGAVKIDTGYQERGVRILQWLVMQKGSERYLFAHLHGVWIAGNTKGDSPERTKQSKLVRAELLKLKRKTGSRQIIFGGDLNLALETEAIRLLQGVNEEEHMLNLIEEFAVRSTRTPLYRQFGDGPQHADYAFVSSRVQVQSFLVDPSFTGSDHAPLMLTIA